MSQPARLLTILALAGPLAAVHAPTLALEPGEFDPARFEALLRTYVREDGVDYAGWKAAGTDELDAFLAELAAYDPLSVMGKEPRAAYWMNAYHAWAVRQILEHWPVERLEDLPGFFDKNRVRLAGAEMTLADVETTLAHLLPNRPQFALGLATGARGGPRFQSAAYTSSNYDSLLRVSIQDLVQRKVIRYEEATNTLHVPPGVELYWSAYTTRPLGFSEAFASHLSLSDLVAINSRKPTRVTDPVDTTVHAAAPSGAPPGRKP